MMPRECQAALILTICLLQAFVSGCNSGEARVVTLKYTTGEKFEEGAIRDFRRRFQFRPKTKQVGTWKRWYPDGALRSIWEFDDSGKLLHEVSFAVDGDTMSAYEYYEQSSVVRAFDDSGALNWKTVTTYPSDDDDPVIEEYTEYYDTGQASFRWKSLGPSEMHEWVSTPDGTVAFEGRTDLNTLKKLSKVSTEGF